MPYRPFNQYPRSDALCTVYLLHFSRPFGHARHYIGVVRELDMMADRVIAHQAGTGATICRHAVRAGIKLFVSRVWINVPRYTEIRLKNRGGAKKLCAICRLGLADCLAEL